MKGNNTPSATHAPVEATLLRAEQQLTLFHALPTRHQLMSLVDATLTSTKLSIRIFRNHGFELVASALPAFMAFCGLGAEVEIGDYDDSLSFGAVQQDSEADLVIVWFDFERYLERMTGQEVADWIEERLTFLRNIVDGPIIVSNWPAASSDATLVNDTIKKLHLPGMHVLDIASEALALGDSFFDERAARLTGTRLSDMACIATARKLTSDWLAHLFLPPIKAIALDLDNTLYGGVLAEDGEEKVKLTTGHRALQLALKAFQNKGLFLALLSKNEENDVRRLFDARNDFPLQWQDFSVHQIGWGSKAEGLKKIADTLNIAPDAMLFIDDNAGELASVAAHWPQVRMIHALEDANTTAVILDRFPGLQQHDLSETGALRIADVAASKKREKLMQATDDSTDYARALNVELHYCMDHENQYQRACEMVIKTNQFNLALARSNAKLINSWFTSTNASVVTWRLSDRLSDSGIIGLLVATKTEEGICVEELCISCRALGRGLEHAMITAALLQVNEQFDVTEIHFKVKEGPRNQPALNWIQDFEKSFAKSYNRNRKANVITLTLDKPKLSNLLESCGAKINWNQDYDQ